MEGQVPSEVYLSMTASPPCLLLAMTQQAPPPSVCPLTPGLASYPLTWGFLHSPSSFIPGH